MPIDFTKAREHKRPVVQQPAIQQPTLTPETVFDNADVNSYFNRAQQQYSTQNDIAQQDEIERKYLNGLIPSENTTQVTDDEWSVLKQSLLNAAKNGGSNAVSEESYKQATAIEISRALNISPLDAYNTMNLYFDNEYKDIPTYKGKWKAFTDSVKLGNNVIRMSKLGADLQAAEKAGDQERIDEVNREIDALDAYNATLQDTMPRSLLMKILEAGGQTLPYTAAVAGPGVITGIIAPEVAPIAGWAAGTAITYGTEYIDLRKAGASPDIARGVAAASAGLQSVIEQTLGTIANTTGQTAGVMLDPLRKQLRDYGLDAISKEISKAAYGKLHFGTKTINAVAKGLMEYGANANEEGLEEAMQSLTSYMFEKVAETLNDKDMNTPGLKEAWDQAIEEYKGGFMGALALGIPDAALSARATAKDFISVKNAAVEAQSKEAFVNKMAEAAKEGSTDSGAKVFEGMSEDKVREDAAAIYDNFQSERTKAADEKAKEYEEITAGEEGTEEVSEAVESGEETVTEEYREDGELYTQNELNEDGTEGTFKAGDAAKEKKNVYGFINYRVDDDKKTVTIDKFSMTGTREYLRSELYRNFAEQFAGYDIEWNTKYDTAAKLKQSLINANPRGAKYGLNYYGDMSEVEDTKTRTDIARQLKNFMPNLSAEERTVEAAILEAGAAANGMNITEYMQKTFNNGQIFGDTKKLEEAAQNAGVEANGGADIQELTDGVRAVIYAGKTANFSTFVHEMSHVWRRQLKYTNPTLLAQAEKALGITDGQWTTDKEEEFARGYEKYLYSGEAANSALKKLYAELTKFFRQVYSAVQGMLNDEIKKVYDELLKGTDSVLKEAAAATERADSTQESTEEKQAAESQEKKTESKEAAADQETESAQLTPQQEAKTVAQQQAENIINDPDASTGEKTEAALDHAAEEIEPEFDENGIPWDIFQKYSRDRTLFQIIGETGALNIDRMNEVTTLHDNLNIAKEMERKGKDAKTIRLATGWEKGADGKWKYEVNDGTIKRYDGNKLLVDKDEMKLLHLKDLLQDAELFNAYPEFKDMYVKFADLESGVNGQYNPEGNFITLKISYAYDWKDGIEVEEEEDEDGNILSHEEIDHTKDLKSTLIHELEHAVQQKENFAKGGDDNSIGYENYRKLAGEVESRNVQKRAAMSPEERLKTLLAETEDVPRNEQIMLFQTAAANTNNLLFQIIGEQGALRLARNGDKELYDNLIKTKRLIQGQMNIDGTWKDSNLPRRIWQTYRWEQGIEGALKSEIEDITINVKNLSVEDLKNNKATLGDIVDGEKVFKAYPTLKKIRVNFFSDPQSDGTYGYYKESDNSINMFNIDLDMHNWGDTYGTLFSHEIQHAIQKIEGFARGGSQELVKSLYASKPTDLQKQLYSYSLEDKEYFNNFTEDRRIQELKENGLTEDEIKESNPVVEDGKTAAKIIEEYVKEYGPEYAYNKVQEAAVFVEREGDIFTNNRFYDSSYDAYMSLAGEVEAYNVQRRLNFTPLERKFKTLDDTEYPHKDKQILLLRNQNNSNGILFQTQQELLDDAASFDDWKEFMDYYESPLAPSDMSMVPSGAPAAWYQDIWEKAKGISPTTLESLQKANESETERDKAAAAQSPAEKDAMFTTALRGVPGMLEAFLTRIQQVQDEQVFQPSDEEEQQYVEHLQTLKNYIGTKIKHRSILSNALRLKGGKELTEQAKKQIVSLMTNGGKVRSYRALYAEFMDDPKWAVANTDTVDAQMQTEAKKYGLDELLGNRPIDALSAEERQKLAERIHNEALKQKIRNGTIKLDSDIDGLIKQYNEDLKAQQEKYDRLKEEDQRILQELTDTQQRDLLKAYDKLLIAQSKYPVKSDTPGKHGEAAAKTGKEYKEGMYRNAIGNYDMLYRQYHDLLQITNVTVELEQAITRREKMAKLNEKIHELKGDVNAVSNLRKLRAKLVKRTLRKVNFNNVSYEQARLIIAAQRIFMPNLRGDVNNWIGQQPQWAREVFSDYFTNEEGRLKIKAQLARRGTKTARRALEILSTLQDPKDFDKLTREDKKILSKSMPRQNWIRELGLDEIEEEKTQALQLPIKFKEVKQTVTDSEGNSNLEVTYMPEVDTELEQQLKEALGADIYSMITGKPVADWSTADMEQFAKAIDNLYVMGRNRLAARKEAEKQQAKEIRDRIRDTVKNVGIVINPGDDDETKKKKIERINRKLGITDTVKGTRADKTKRLSLWNRIVNGYSDANIHRVARILDNQSEGTNTQLLYREEDRAYTVQERNKEKRVERINKAMQDNGVTVADLMQKITVDTTQYNPVTKEILAGGLKEFTADELLYFYMAQFDDYSKEAVMYGSMMDIKDRERYQAMDDSFWKADREREQRYQEAFEAGDKIGMQMNADQKQNRNTDAEGHIIAEGTAAYKEVCEDMYEAVLDAARKLDPKYFAFANAIQDDYSDNYDRLNEISIKVFNQPMSRTDTYVPLVRLSMSGDTNENRVKADLLAQTAEAATQQGVDKGFTQRRVHIAPLNQMPVETGLYKTWADSLDRTEHFIAYSDYVRTLRRIYTSRDAQGMMQWIESRYGKGMALYLKDYINELANPTAGETHQAWEQVVRTLRGKTAPAYLSWKLSSILKQAVTSPAPFMQFISPKEYTVAALSMLKNYKFINDMIKEKSVFMRDRQYDPIVDLINEQADKADNKVKAAWAQFQKTGMSGLEWIDWACVAPGWLAIYKKEKARLENETEAKYQAQLAEEKELEFMAPVWKQRTDQEIETAARAGLMDAAAIEEAAIFHADDCTRLCQPSNRKVDLSPLFKNGSELQKAFLQFTTSLNVIWQNIRYDLPYAVKQKQYKQIAGMIAGYTIAGVALGILAGDMPAPGDDDKERQEKLKKLVFDATTQFTDAVPMIGAAVTSASEKMITGKGTYQNSTDLFPTLTKAMQGTMALTDADWSKALTRYGEAVGMYLGVPVSGTKEALYAAGIGDKKKGLEAHPEAVLGQRN